MKKIAFILLAISFCLTTSVGQAQDDTAAIKAVIENETTAFFGVDRVAWEKNWLKAPYCYWSYADSTGVSYVEGTESITRNFNEYFQTAKPSTSKIERVWLQVRVYGKGAYVRFIQKASDGIDRDETSETRMLEKDKDGKWKIICLIAIANYANK